MRKNHEFRSGLSTAMAGLIAFGLVLSPALAVPALRVVGDWEGTLDTGSGSLRVVVHLSQSKEESLAGTLDSPDQGATGIAMTTITFEQPALHFEITQFRCSYDGKINKDSSEITGQWKQGGGSMALSFKRIK